MNKPITFSILILTILFAMNVYDVVKMEKDLEFAKTTIEIQNDQIKELQQELLGPYLRENDSKENSHE